MIRIKTVSINNGEELQPVNGNVNLPITKNTVGLGNVDNTADANKSVAHAGTADVANSVAWGNVTGKPSTFTPSSHTHDDRYYTESEINSKLDKKSNTGHTHSYLPLSGGALTGTLDLQNHSAIIEFTNG